MLTRSIVRRLAFRPAPLLRYAHSLPNIQVNSVTEQDVTHFSKILPATSILSTLSPVSSASTELDPFNNDWMNKYHGKSTTVLRPRTTEEVSEIVKWCNERRIGIVPQGGNTGLVGGGVPIKDELILSLGNMTKIRSFDPVSGELYQFKDMYAVVCGVLCKNMQEYWSRMQAVCWNRSRNSWLLMTI